MAAALFYKPLHSKPDEIEGLKLKLYVIVVNGDVVTLGMSIVQTLAVLYSFTPYSAKLH